MARLCQYPWYIDRVSFVAEFNSLPLAALVKRSQVTTLAAARESLSNERPSLADFAQLISPVAGALLEDLGRRSHALTQKRFGKVIRLFAPLYLSNECINNCKYCGFSRDNPILRVTLSLAEVRREAAELQRQGFRNVLLVAGEHPKFVSNGYMADCVAAVRESAPSVSLEVGPMETAEYQPLVAAGFRRLGLGALYGLADWRYEALCVAAHADYLLRHCWKAQVTISLPRLRPCAGEFQPLTHMSDRELVQLLCAFRLMFPDVGLVLSTRESPKLRDGLFPLGVTLISAGSHTEPGGYTGAGRETIHQTVRGRIVERGASEWAGPAAEGVNATGQFQIADERTPEQVAEFLRKIGYEPVWKDWDAALMA
jgi:2-iminoacetate synthase